MAEQYKHPIITEESSWRTIKCIVWDLDQTLWDGVLLEDLQVTLKPGVREIIQTLDSRGILHSIASKNDEGVALARLEELGLRDFFLVPQIHWNAKSISIQEIARFLNIGLDAIAFLDDQAFERDEVAYALPEVLCLGPDSLPGLLECPELKPRFLTEDGRQRRKMYLDDQKRQKDEQAFERTPEAFLASLGMVLTLAPATEADLQRAEELTVRTHQLNTTGYTYSYEQLDAFRQSDRHQLLIAGLDDKYGSYGKIGLILLSCDPEVWAIQLFLMSCRVMSRGVGSILLNYLIKQARWANVRLQAEFVSNNRNRLMLITYKFGGFKVKKQEENFILFEHDLCTIPDFPDYVDLRLVGLDRQR